MTNSSRPWLKTFEHRNSQLLDSYVAMRERILKDGAIPAKYKLLMAMVTDAIAAHPDGVRTLAVDARAAGASEAEIAEAVDVGKLFRGTAAPVMGVNALTTTKSRRAGWGRGGRNRRDPAPATVKTCTALCGAALIISAVLLVRTTPPSWADVCGDIGGARVSAGGCSDPGAPIGDPPPPQGGLSQPPWLGAIQHRDPQFADSYMAMRERILKDGAIPAKYKLLMAMVTDAIAAHPDGVRTLADNARAADASEPEVTEAVEVGYPFGGTAALVMGANAFSSQLQRRSMCELGPVPTNANGGSPGCSGRAVDQRICARKWTIGPPG
jgi:alkylhydroperoxidase/carboxymuconolactone decarboxylase family protein YurZ